MKPTKENKKESSEKETIGKSITFNKKTLENIDAMAQLPEYRNNRSMVVETLVTTHLKYVDFVRDKKKK